MAKRLLGAIHLAVPSVGQDGRTLTAMAFRTFRPAAETAQAEKAKKKAKKK